MKWAGHVKRMGDEKAIRCLESGREKAARKTENASEGLR